MQTPRRITALRSRVWACSMCAEDDPRRALRGEFVGIPGRATRPRATMNRAPTPSGAPMRPSSNPCATRHARRAAASVPRGATSGDDSVRSRSIRGVRTDDTTPPTSAIGRPCGLLQEVTVLRERLPPSRSSGGLTRPRPPASPNEVENNEQIANRLTPPWVPSVPWFTAARSASLNRRAVELHRVLAPRAAFRNGALPIAATLWHCDRPRPPSSIAGGCWTARRDSTGSIKPTRPTSASSYAKHAT